MNWDIHNKINIFKNDIVTLWGKIRNGVIKQVSKNKFLKLMS